MKFFQNKEATFHAVIMFFQVNGNRVHRSYFIEFYGCIINIKNSLMSDKNMVFNKVLKKSLKKVLVNFMRLISKEFFDDSFVYFVHFV